MPKTIVVPLDGSTFAERALRPAAEIARRVGAHVVVMTARYGGVVVEPKRYLEATARTAGIDDPEGIVVEGKLAASAIASIVEEKPDAVVVMTTRARQGLGVALFGSVAEEVLRDSTGATLLVGPSARDEPMHFAELIVCVDGSGFSDAILPFAATWARDLDLDIVLLRVSEPDPEHASHASVLATRALEDLQRTVSELQTRYGSVQPVVLHHRRPAQAIAEFASTHPRALLALATHGRTGLGRLSAGSVATEVMRDAPCPVLLTRPAGLE